MLPHSRQIVGEPFEVTAARHASEITAKIRAERSSKNLGFGVALRAELALTADHRQFWNGIERDVLAGNNVVAADVRFGERLEVTIEPQPANA